jgi:hypothetical protein
MATHEIMIEFQEVSPAQADRYATELQDALKQAVSDMRIERIRSDPQAQDFGTTLAIVLGTPAVVVLATALKNWLTRRNQAKLRLKTKNGVILAENLESKDVAAIVTAISGQGERS